MSSFISSLCKCIRTKVLCSLGLVLKTDSGVLYRSNIWWWTREGCECSFSVVKSAEQDCHDHTLGDFFHHQTYWFDANVSTERSGCLQLDWCVASVTAHCRGRRRDLARLLPVELHHYWRRASGQQTTTGVDLYDCRTTAAVQLRLRTFSWILRASPFLLRSIFIYYPIWELKGIVNIN